jgi:hypothetical protein
LESNISDSLRTALIVDAMLIVFFTGLGLSIHLTYKSTPDPTEQRAPQPQPPDPFEGERTVRGPIRKLHLVRPDLIPTRSSTRSTADELLRQVLPRPGLVAGIAIGLIIGVTIL